MNAGRSIALIDVNNFYASCERVFNPTLAGKPLAILSNNDGCVIARSAELKAMGVKMGTPWFQLKDNAERQGILAMSSNYALYQDMSNRVMEIIGEFAPYQEIYSIDESFLDMTGIRRRHTDIALEMRARIKQYTGLPVCVGIGPSKTLAKLANHVAKKRPQYGGALDLSELSPAALDDLLASIECGDIWGIGRRLAPKLQELGISNALQLKQADPEFIRQQFSVVMEKTVRELQGQACIELEEIAPPKKEIISSRSFGTRVRDLQSLEESVSLYMATAAEKLRRQASYAGALRVFIMTSPFGDGPKYANSKVISLPSPTDDTRQLIGVALWLLRKLYMPGFDYLKAGVGLLEIMPAGGQQTDMFGFTAGNGKATKLMITLDAVNRKMGKGKLRLASQGYKAPWAMKQERMSKSFTTKWEDVLQIQI